MKELNAWAARFVGDPVGLLSTSFTESTSVAMALVDTLMARGFDFTIVTTPNGRCVVVVSRDTRMMSSSEKPRERIAEAIVEACRGAIDDTGRESEGRSEESAAAVS